MQSIKIILMRKYFNIGVLWVIPALLTIIPLFAFASEDLSNWQKKRDILIPAGVSDFVYVTIPADSDIGLHNFTDLRVVTGDWRIVPYELVVEDSESSRVRQRSTVIDPVTDSEGRFMFILQLEEEGGLHNAINLSFAPGEFRRNVSVYASGERLSHDDPGWRKVTGDGYVFSFFDERTRTHIERSRIDYPESTAEFLRVVIEPGAGEVPDLISVAVERRVSKKAGEFEIKRQADVSHNEKDKTTEIVIDLGSRGVPVRAVRLETEEKDFYRDVIVQRSVDGVRWRNMGSDSLFRIRASVFGGERLEITFPEMSERYIRVVVFNYDDAPVEFDESVYLTGISRAVVFRAEVGEIYMLLYGNGSARTPRYDLARFFHYFDVLVFPRAELSASSENPLFEAVPEEGEDFGEKYGFILNIVLIVVVIVSAVIVVFTIKRAKEGGETSVN